MPCVHISVTFRTLNDCNFQISMMTQDTPASDAPAASDVDTDAVTSQTAQISLEDAPAAGDVSEEVESPEEANRKDRLRKRE